VIIAKDIKMKQKEQMKCFSCGRMIDIPPSNIKQIKIEGRYKTTTWKAPKKCPYCNNNPLAGL